MAKNCIYLFLFNYFYKYHLKVGKVEVELVFFFH